MTSCKPSQRALLSGITQHHHLQKTNILVHLENQLDSRSKRISTERLVELKASRDTLTDQ